MPKLFNIYVIWRLDGEWLTTLLQYEDAEQQRQAMLGWSMRQYVEQAYDAEYLEESPEYPNPVAAGEPFECLGVFESADLRWVY